MQACIVCHVFTNEMLVTIPVFAMRSLMGSPTSKSITICSADSIASVIEPRLRFLTVAASDLLGRAGPALRGVPEPAEDLAVDTAATGLAAVSGRSRLMRGSIDSV